MARDMRQLADASLVGQGRARAVGRVRPAEGVPPRRHLLLRRREVQGVERAQPLLGHGRVAACERRALTTSHTFIMTHKGKCRLVINLRWLNEHCRFESLMLRRLARCHDFMFSLDLTDAYHHIGYHGTTSRSRCRPPRAPSTSRRARSTSAGRSPCGWNSPRSRKTRVVPAQPRGAPGQGDGGSSGAAGERDGRAHAAVTGRLRLLQAGRATQRLDVRGGVRGGVPSPRLGLVVFGDLGPSSGCPTRARQTRGSSSTTTSATASTRRGGSSCSRRGVRRAWRRRPPI